VPVEQVEKESRALRESIVDVGYNMWDVHQMPRLATQTREERHGLASVPGRPNCIAQSRLRISKRVVGSDARVSGEKGAYGVTADMAARRVNHIGDTLRSQSRTRSGTGRVGEASEIKKDWGCHWRRQSTGRFYITSMTQCFRIGMDACGLTLPMHRVRFCVEAVRVLSTTQTP